MGLRPILSTLLVVGSMLVCHTPTAMASQASPSTSIALSGGVAPSDSVVLMLPASCAGMSTEGTLTHQDVDKRTLSFSIPSDAWGCVLPFIDTHQELLDVALQRVTVSDEAMLGLLSSSTLTSVWWAQLVGGDRVYTGYAMPRGDGTQLELRVRGTEEPLIVSTPVTWKTEAVRKTSGGEDYGWLEDAELPDPLDIEDDYVAYGCVDQLEEALSEHGLLDEFHRAREGQGTTWNERLMLRTSERMAQRFRDAAPECAWVQWNVSKPVANDDLGSVLDERVELDLFLDGRPNVEGNGWIIAVVDLGFSGLATSATDPRIRPGACASSGSFLEEGQGCNIRTGVNHGTRTIEALLEVAPEAMVIPIRGFESSTIYSGLRDWTVWTSIDGDQAGCARLPFNAMAINISVFGSSFHDGNYALPNSTSGPFGDGTYDAWGPLMDYLRGACADTPQGDLQRGVPVISSSGNQARRHVYVEQLTETMISPYTAGSIALDTGIMSALVAADPNSNLNFATGFQRYADALARYGLSPDSVLLVETPTGGHITVNWDDWRTPMFEQKDLQLRTHVLRVTLNANNAYSATLEPVAQDCADAANIPAPFYAQPVEECSLPVLGNPSTTAASFSVVSLHGPQGIPVNAGAHIFARNHGNAANSVNAMIYDIAWLVDYTYGVQDPSTPPTIQDFRTPDETFSTRVFQNSVVEPQAHPWAILVGGGDCCDRLVSTPWPSSGAMVDGWPPEPLQFGHGPGIDTVNYSNLHSPRYINSRLPGSGPLRTWGQSGKLRYFIAPSFYEDRFGTFAASSAAMPLGAGALLLGLQMADDAGLAGDQIVEDAVVGTLLTDFVRSGFGEEYYMGEGMLMFEDHEDPPPSTGWVCPIFGLYSLSGLLLGPWLLWGRRREEPEPS